MKKLKTEIQDLKSGMLCKLIGEIKGIEALKLKNDMRTYASQQKLLCIDLTEVTEISLTGVNAILMSKVYAKKQNNEVILVMSKESKVLQQLHLTKLTDQFTLNFTDLKKVAV